VTYEHFVQIIIILHTVNVAVIILVKLQACSYFVLHGFVHLY